MNQRVKGTEKFWNETGGEAILQVRAAYLSEDERAETFHSRRPTRAGGRPQPTKNSCMNGRSPCSPCEVEL
jgi:hypothetical protein